MAILPNVCDISETTSLSDCITSGYVNNNYLTAGDCTITTTDNTTTGDIITVVPHTTTGIRCFSGTSTITIDGSNNTSFVTYDKRIIYGQEGDVMMDVKNMKFKVYSDEKGWVEYEIENFSTKTIEGKKQIVLEGSKEVDVSEIIAERSKRIVLVEKMKKPKEVELFSFLNIDGTNTIWMSQPLIFYTGTDYNTTGTNNTALGYAATTAGAFAYDTQGNITVSTGTGTVAINGNTEINGNLEVLGDVSVSGNIRVKGNIKKTHTTTKRNASKRQA
jgi:hypothetical protein